MCWNENEDKRNKIKKILKRNVGDKIQIVVLIYHKFSRREQGFLAIERNLNVDCDGIAIANIAVSVPATGEDDF